jgi:hypothetical protein
MNAPRTVTREEFDEVCEAIWSELEYQNNLPRRTDDEAQNIAAFLTLARRYMRTLEDEWADNAGVTDEALSGLRKVAAIFSRAMIYNGVIKRWVYNG